MNQFYIRHSGKLISLIFIVVVGILLGCQNSQKRHLDSEQSKVSMTAKEILGNPSYPAISYGGYRQTTRDVQPTIEELKEDMFLLSALGIKIIRTYHTKRPHALNTIKAIAEIKQENPDFEMYVMVGVWIDCKGAWTDVRDHSDEEEVENRAEIDRAVKMAQNYPDIVKIIAVGNEAMVKWAETYYVEAGIILKWVNYLQKLKSEGVLDNRVWITSSDNFASWGGGSEEYHTKDLEELIKAVDYVSLHTYPMHDTHYNPDFWGVNDPESELTKEEQIESTMKRSLEYAATQYNNTKKYINSIDPQKSIHIGETGWASASNGFYGPNGSKATDEYKQGIYYDLMREWTDENNISCFYFEAFDESWKDAENPGGSENHFGLFDVNGLAKFPIWDDVDAGKFDGLTRGGNPITKSFEGDMNKLLQHVEVPDLNEQL